MDYQSLKAGATLHGGNYKIIKVLGQGGFGITYLAEQTMLDRKVAIKEFFMKEFCDRDNATSHVTLGTKSSSETVARFKEKFLKEARNIAKLSHPNIVHIIDVFEENGTAYYVMEYADGGSLNDLIKRRGAISESEALGYIRKVASALSYIHSKNINHLDIKPSNIMLRENDGEIFVIDFGLSKQYDQTTGGQTSTTPVGISEGFAPIEQYRQGGVSSFSPQTDIYSLGATLYKLITGATPPQPMDIMSDGLPQIPYAKASKATQDAIAKAMKIQKSERPASVDEFLKILNSTSIDNQSRGGHENTIFVVPEEADSSTNNSQTPPPPIPSYPQSKNEENRSDYSSNDSQPEESNDWWAWLLVPGMIILILLLLVSSKGCSNKGTGSESLDDASALEIIDMDGIDDDGMPCIEQIQLLNLHIQYSQKT